MNNTDQLLIRACKSKDPMRRVISVYKRFYYRGEYNLRDIAQILSSVCASNAPIQPDQLISDLNPLCAWKFIDIDKEYNYCEHVTNVLISNLRHTAASKIPGFIVPSKFKHDKRICDTLETNADAE